MQTMNTELLNRIDRLVDAVSALTERLSKVETHLEHQAKTLDQFYTRHLAELKTDSTLLERRIDELEKWKARVVGIATAAAAGGGVITATVSELIK